MALKIRTNVLTCVAFCFLLVISTACSRGGGRETLKIQGEYPVDPVFKEFYDSLGGEPVLGPAISPLFQNSGKLYQYTVAALMVNDPKALDAERYRLAALGADMGVNDLPVQPPEQPDVPYLNGHIVYKDFVPLFNQLQGLTYAGKPLTEVRHNLEKRRFEQYFENVGFYRLEDAPSDEVHLLAYGAWKCRVSCRFQPLQEAVIFLPASTAAPFIRMVNRLGSDFTGFALTVPFLAEDGNLEQIYENVVMVANPEYPDRVSLRPLPVKLGINPEALEEPKPDPNYTFYPIEPGRGYNIPNEFMEYIQKHGGTEFSGVPITHLFDLGAGATRQCFANICLEGHAERPPGQRVLPLPMGYTYRDIYYHPSGAGEQGAPLEVSLQIWESSLLVNQNQTQEIGVEASANGQPLANLVPMLTLTLPEGVAKSYTMPPTNMEGESRITLEPLPVQSGSLIPYQICVTAGRSQTFCVRDSFLVWDSHEIEGSRLGFFPTIMQFFFSDIFYHQFMPSIFR